jgi:uncharacterized Zn-finger protein
MHGTFASSLGRLTRALQMESYPKFHNEVGVSIVRIGCREFKCIGDKPPQDHPHIYLNMGDAREIGCPYCSTLFRFDPSLGAHEADRNRLSTLPPPAMSRIARNPAIGKRAEHMIEQVSSARRPNIGTTRSIFERCAAFVRERAHYSILNRWYGFIVASVMQIIGCKLVPHGLG